MTVDDLRLLLKNKPGDMKVLFGYLDSDYEDNQFLEIKNVSEANLTQVGYDEDGVYSELSFPEGVPKENVLVLYNKCNIYFRSLEPCIVKS
jgi:hypothetical protein